MLSYNEINQKFAFSIVNYFSKELKDDSRYVKLQARLLKKVNREFTETILPLHRCTEEDFEQFYPLN